MRPVLSNHYHEKPPRQFTRLFDREDPGLRKITFWNAFVDSQLTEICDDDCAVLPRILPASYLRTIKGVCSDISLFLMRLLSLPTREIEAMLPHTPVRDFLISELGVLKYRPERLTGCIRFDMAMAGPAIPSNPPKLLEINDIGFDGVGRSSFIQETFLKLNPHFKQRLIALDTAHSDAMNMRRTARRLALFCYDSYHWGDEVLQTKAHRAGVAMRMVSPSVFNVDIDPDYTKLSRERVGVRHGRLQVGADSAHAFQLNYSLELKDYIEGKRLFGDLVRAKIPHYSPFITGLVGTKTILVLLADRSLARRLVGPARAGRMAPSILPTILFEGNDSLTTFDHRNMVLKHADGMGGEMVHMGREMRRKAARISARNRGHWVLQERVALNAIDVHGILSRPRRVIADIAAYIQYDWNGSRFTNFAVGGFISRGTNRSMKVNVSGGGIQIPVMFDRAG